MAGEMTEGEMTKEERRMETNAEKLLRLEARAYRLIKKIEYLKTELGMAESSIDDFRENWKVTGNSYETPRVGSESRKEG